MYLPEPAEELQQCSDAANIPGDQHELNAPTSLQKLKKTWRKKRWSSLEIPAH